MNGVAASQTTSVPASPRLRLALLVLFFGSGCAALIYEVVWFQLLALVIGSSAVSLGILIGRLHGRIVRGQRRLSSPRLPKTASVARLCVAGTRHRMPGDRGHVPGSLCGAVLRLARRPGSLGIPVPRVDRRRLFVPFHRNDGCDTPGARSIGGHNTSRRVVARPVLRGKHSRSVGGCLSAGFYLLRIHDMHAASYVAAALNGMLALTAWLLSDPFRARVNVGLARSCRGRAGSGTSSPALSARHANRRVRLRRATPWEYGHRMRCFRRGRRHRSISPSLCPDCARWAPKWSGRGCCR